MSIKTLEEIEIEEPTDEQLGIKTNKAEVARKEVSQKVISVERGLINPDDHVELSGFIRQLAKGGAFPKRFEKFEQQLAAYNLSRSLMNENWQLAVNNIASIHGSMVIFGELPAALAEKTKEVEEKNVYLIDKEMNKICLANKNIDKEPWAGVCELKRKGRTKNEYFWTVDQCKKSGQLPASASSPWSKFLGVMLMRKAQALAMKMEFPDVLAGVQIAEYDNHSAPDLQDFRDVTEELNNNLKKLAGE